MRKLRHALAAIVLVTCSASLAAAQPSYEVFYLGPVNHVDAVNT